MDSFDKKIEQYRQELLKYAQKHGNVYGSNVQPQKEEITKYTEQKTRQEKIYNPMYVNNRPMPPEYDGNEQVDIPQANITPAPDTDNIRNSGKSYGSYNDFFADNKKSGKLRVQAYASRQVFPIQNAKVTVIKEFNDTNHVFAEAFTDIDGVAQNIVLPTKDKSLSLTAGGEIPYATYKVIVSHPRFITQIYENVPIFDSIESMQPAAMLPLSNTGNTQITPEDEPRL